MTLLQFLPQSANVQAISRSHIRSGIALRNMWRELLTETLGFEQDTWHMDQLMFDEDQAAAFSTMLSGTSYCEFSAIVARRES